MAVALDVVVKVELHPVGQPDLHLLKKAVRCGSVPMILETPPTFDAHLPRFLLDVNARAWKTAGAGPFGPLRFANGRIFAEHGTKTGGGGLRHPRDRIRRIGGQRGSGQEREDGEFNGVSKHGCLGCWLQTHANARGDRPKAIHMPAQNGMLSYARKILEKRFAG